MFLPLLEQNVLYINCYLGLRALTNQGRRLPQLFRRVSQFYWWWAEYFRNWGPDTSEFKTPKMSLIELFLISYATFALYNPYSKPWL